MVMKREYAFCNGSVVAIAKEQNTALMRIRRGHRCLILVGALVHKCGLGNIQYKESPHIALQSAYDYLAQLLVFFSFLRKKR